jgi:hypothetical protein
VDGQQRLATIFEFLDGDLPLSSETTKRFGGPHYSELHPDTSDKLDDFKIDYEEITEAEPGEVQEYFLRLQQGLQLTSAERLNAVVSNLTSFARKLAKHEFFKSKVAIRDYRLAHFDICCKIVALELEGFSMRLRLPELEDLLRSHASFSSNSNIAKRTHRTIDYPERGSLSGAVANAP